MLRIPPPSMQSGSIWIRICSRISFRARGGGLFPNLQSDLQRIRSSKIAFTNKKSGSHDIGSELWHLVYDKKLGTARTQNP